VIDTNAILAVLLAEPEKQAVVEATMESVHARASVGRASRSLDARRRRLDLLRGEDAAAQPEDRTPRRP
jgi:hypothetical protein